MASPEGTQHHAGEFYDAPAQYFDFSDLIASNPGGTWSFEDEHGTQFDVDDVSRVLEYSTSDEAAARLQDSSAHVPLSRLNPLSSPDDQTLLPVSDDLTISAYVLLCCVCVMTLTGLLGHVTVICSEVTHRLRRGARDVTKRLRRVDDVTKMYLVNLCVSQLVYLLVSLVPVVMTFTLQDWRSVADILCEYVSCIIVILWFLRRGITPWYSPSFIYF